MAKETRGDSGHADDKDRDARAVAAETKSAAKKVTKKKSKAKTKKKSAAKKSKSDKQAAPARAEPEPPASPAPAVHASSVPPPHESRSSGPMRGIVALWGPLAIIVLLIVVARIGDEAPVGVSGGDTASLPASLESAEGIAGDVVEDVRDALTGGDPRAAAALGAGSGASRSPREDLAAAFQDAGSARSSAGQGAPPPRSTAVADPWDASGQTTVPAGMAARPGALPPYPDNPWAPVDPLAPENLQADPYSQGVPPPPGPPGGRGYGRHSGGYGPGGGMYADPEQPYARHRRGYGPPPGYAERGPGYGPPPGYGERGPGYGRRHAYGGAPGYGPPPGYGEDYPYAQPYYGEPAPYYPRDYYPPAQ